MNARARHRRGWVQFALESRRFALPLENVERVVRAAEVTPLPEAPAAVLGALNVAGAVLPVFDLHARFGLGARPLHPSQQFIIVRSPRRRLVLRVNEALGLIEESEIHGIEPPPEQAPQIQGVLSLAEGLVLIHDVERILDDAGHVALNAALRALEVRRGG